MARFSKLSKQLQTAINQKSEAKLLINTKQWYSKDKRRPVTIYQVQLGEGKERQVIFKTYSQIQLLLYLRDYWYVLNGWEVPHDNEQWEEAKMRYANDADT